MRILGVERDDKACNFYRIFQPLNKIAQHELADVRLIELGDQLDSEENMAKILEADVILLPRPSSEEWFKFVRSVQKAGKVLVSDYDDDPFSTSPLNPYYRWIGVKEYSFKWADGTIEEVWKDGMKGPDGEEYFNIEKNINRRDMCRAAFKKSNLVTATTQILADTFSVINPNVCVLPNLIDLNIYPKIEIVKRKVRIGWQGGVSHYEDLWTVKDALKIIGDKYDVDIVFFGDDRIMAPVKDVHGYKFEHWVGNEVYPLKLSTLNLDIGICPLVDNEFNRNKSCIKYLEYSAIGAATIASNVSPYKEVITNGQNGLLVENTTEAWVDAISRLIKDKRKREALAHNAYEDVLENHNADKKAHLWVSAYARELKKESVLV
jgi:glycosyltransferase involved in cell wall biosynthesis